MTLTYIHRNEAFMGATAMDSETWTERYGPWALVTGASSGIGKEMALLAAERGLNVALCARSEEKLHALASDIEARGRQARVIVADLTLPTEADRLLAETDDLEIGLYVPAAGFGSAGNALKIPNATERAMVALNCQAVIATTQPLAQKMAARGHGGVILFGSILSFQGVSGFATYAATKAFVHSLAEGLIREYSAAGIDVLALAPGPTATGFGARAGLPMRDADGASVVAAEAFDALGRRKTLISGPLSRRLWGVLGRLPRAVRSKLIAQSLGRQIQGDPATRT